ncbi:hypothetical protein PIROE2DRAFT_16955 [Piromyces sp. E2]|nr:hypothetical protein PIROE2DRAFT_16955 [Piromyces sp. E2]|eukprot:OUM57905.1 hypothetical protein PIROE2DRAFT_16955 [Piromyces sp. E2]
MKLYYVFIIFLSHYVIKGFLRPFEKRDDEIKKIQENLMKLGYSCGLNGADGMESPEMKFCIYSFQQVNKIFTSKGYPSGELNEKTKLLLLNYNTNDKNSTTLIRNNVNGDETIYTDFKRNLTLKSEGEDVKRAQIRLMLLGYNCGNGGANGVIGTETESCIKEFQNNNNITENGEASGIIDYNTHKVLFSNDAISINKINNTISKIVNTALGEIGYEEMYINKKRYTKYGYWYSVNPGAWCGMFVSWVFNENKIDIKNSNIKNMRDQLEKEGKLILYNENKEYIPKYGDMVFYNWEGKKEITRNNHVALTIGYDKGKKILYTIEGNISDKGPRNKVLCKINIITDNNRKKIIGFGKIGNEDEGYVINNNVTYPVCIERKF